MTHTAELSLLEEQTPIHLPAREQSFSLDEGMRALCSLGLTVKASPDFTSDFGGYVFDPAPALTFGYADLFQNTNTSTLVRNYRGLPISSLFDLIRRQWIGRTRCTPFIVLEKGALFENLVLVHLNDDVQRLVSFPWIGDEIEFDSISTLDSRALRSGSRFGYRRA